MDSGSLKSRKLNFLLLSPAVKMRRYYELKTDDFPNVLDFLTTFMCLTKGPVFSLVASRDVTFMSGEVEELKALSKSLLEVSSWLVAVCTYTNSTL